MATNASQIHPMKGSAADQRRRKISAAFREVCEMIDREIARCQDSALPPATSDETPIYRQGLRDGMRRVATMLERGEPA